MVMENIFKNENNYILPRLKIFQSFEDIQSESGEYEDFLLDKFGEKNLIDYFVYPRTFVIAEPGYGKTRLLKELSIINKSLGEGSLRVDLKKISPQMNLFDYLKLCINELSESNRFQIVDSNDIFLCLDGLDEVKQENFSETIDKIKSFVLHYPKVFIALSCRLHFFKKYQELFVDTDFRYLRIYPFSMENIKEYLSRATLSDNDIEKLVNSLQFRHRNLIIQTPRYLEMLLTYIKEKGIKDIANITRVDLFEYFIYQKLEIEDMLRDAQKRDLVKRLLEKLALIMEIYQTNLLTKDELMTFFDDLHSDLKLGFLQQVPLEIFFDKSLLKDNGDTIEFDNTEFQEYLAAKEITRLGQVKQTVFDLSIDPELREIFPSWFNTLTFLLELDITLLKPILDFGSHGKDQYIQDEEYHRFLTRADVNTLVEEERKIIFKQIFDYYQAVLHWIDWDIARSLSSYFDISYEALIKRYLNKKFVSETERRVQLGNLAKIIGFIFERQIFNNHQKDYWKKKLIKFTLDKNENGVLQRHAMVALGHLKDDSIIDKVSLIWEHGDSLVKDEFLKFCTLINPNHPTSIKHFVEGTKKSSIYARLGLFLITDKEGIEELLQCFIDDELFTQTFIDQESIFKDRDGQIIQNIAHVWNEKVKEKLEAILQTIFGSEYKYEAERSEFIKEILRLLKERDKKYIFKFIKQIAASNKLKKNIFSIQHIFSEILELNQVKDFISEMSKIDQGEKIALWTLQGIKFSKRSNANDIYEEGRKYLSSQYLDSEKYWEKQNTKPPAELHIYHEFQHKLHPAPKQFISDLFEYYLNHQADIEKYITLTEKNEFIDLLTNTVLDKFDPGIQKLTITDQTGGSKLYTTHSWISIFGSCIKVSQRLHIDVTKYRSKIISYIPFSYYEHLKAIFDLIKDITPQETNSLIKVYTDKSSDLRRYLPDSLIETAKQYSIKEATPILRQFMEDDDFSIYDRISSMETAEALDPNKDLLITYFKKFEEANEKLAEKSNKLLIERYLYSDAVDWRFKQIIKRAFKFAELQEVHSVGEPENELHEKEFASPLMKLKDLSYQSRYLDLLGYSFKLIKIDKMYYSYAQYLWQIVYAYFDNLKEMKSYKPLKELGLYIKEHSNEDGVNWFSGKIKELRRSYMNYIGKPQSVAECISLYNNLKTRAYLKVINSHDLLEKVKDSINNELKIWVNGEGSKLMQLDEIEVQKNIKVQIDNILLRKGFRPNEIIFIREPQLLDDKRTDFLIFYGFVGPIIIEIKLGRSSELVGKLKTKKSYTSMIHYMQNYRTNYGIFLVVGKQPKTTPDKWNKLIKKVVDAYQEINNVEVLDI